MTRITSVAVAVAGALSVALLAGCSTSSADEGRPGTVSEASYSGLKATRPDGVALLSDWDTDGRTGDDRTVGSKETPPSMMKATCFGKYPDLSIKVEGPDDAVLLAKSGDKTMNVRFAELGPVDITPSASEYKWGPTGVELKINSANQANDKWLPEELEARGVRIMIRMLVTCP